LVILVEAVDGARGRDHADAVMRIWHAFGIGEVLWDVERYVCNERDRSAMPNAPQKRPLQGVPVRRIDHINYMTTDVPATKRFFEQQLSFRCRERVELADRTELGVWLSVDVLAHEVAVM
jgi:catechol 2,3-dioxygenase